MQEDIDQPYIIVIVNSGPEQRDVVLFDSEPKPQTNYLTVKSGFKNMPYEMICNRAKKEGLDILLWKIDATNSEQLKKWLYIHEKKGQSVHTTPIDMLYWMNRNDHEDIREIKHPVMITKNVSVEIPVTPYTELIVRLYPRLKP